MNIIKELLKDITIPKMLKIKQHFNDRSLDNIEGILRVKLK